MEEQFSRLGEDKSSYVSQGKQKNGKKKYTQLQKTYNILISGGIFPNYNYIICIDTIKIVSLMQHVQEKLWLKSDRLQNITIAGHKFKNIPVYERGGKSIQSFFNNTSMHYQNTKVQIVFTTFHDIVKLLTMCGESKSGLSKYYIKFCHGKNFFDHILDRIGQMDFNGSSFINIIVFSKSLKK